MHRVTSPVTPGYDLAARERELLALMNRGLNNTEVAGPLTVSCSTVKFHVGSVLSKLGVTTHTQATALAVQHHLLD